MSDQKAIFTNEPTSQIATLGDVTDGQYLVLGMQLMGQKDLSKIVQKLQEKGERSLRKEPERSSKRN